MKKNKKIIIATIIIVVILVITLVAVLIYKGNTGKLPFVETKEEIVKMVENDNLKVTINDVATTKDYMIIEYEIEGKIENEFENASEYKLKREVKVNGKTIASDTDGMEQMVYKESDKKIKLYDLINISDKDIPEDYKLEIDAYDWDRSIREQLKNVEINSDQDTNNELENNDEEEIQTDEEEIQEDDTETENVEEEATGEEEPEEVDANMNEVQETTEDIENTETDDEDTQDDETDIESDDENSVEIKAPETDNTTTNEVETPFQGYSKIGTLREELSKTETTSNATTNTKVDKTETEDTTTTVKQIIKTKSAKFIVVETEMKNVSSEKMEQDETYYPQNLSINVQDANGNSINVNKLQDVQMYDKNGKNWDGPELVGDDEDGEVTTIEEGTAKIKTVIGLIGENKDLSKIKIQPYFYRTSGDESEQNINNKKWYNIEDKEYSNTNRYSATINVTGIDTDENTIKIHFTKEGFIPEEEPMIIAKNTSKAFNYSTPDEITDDGDGKYTAEFALTGDEELMEDEDFILLDKIENTQFAIFEDREERMVGSAISLDI